LKVRIAVGIVLVLIGLIGIVSLPFSMMNGHRRDYCSSTYYSAATISAQGAGFSQFISMDQAKAIADHYLDSLNNPDLIIKEIMEFQSNFYIMIYEKSSGVGAFEMLIWKTDPSGMMGYDGNYGGMMGRGMMVGQIMPEPGPNMMWNTKYGGMMGQMGGGMMGGGMMGGQQGRTSTADVPIGEAEARTIGQQYLDRYFPGATIDGVNRFYGYYTFDFEKDGKIQGMFSVNGYTGQTWYHGWHGAFIDENEF
jgi:hypothetical protein